MDADKIIEAFEQLLRAHIELYKARWGLGSDPEEDIFFVKAKEAIGEIEKLELEKVNAKADKVTAENLCCVLRGKLNQVTQELNKIISSIKDGSNS